MIIIANAQLLTLLPQKIRDSALEVVGNQITHFAMVAVIVSAQVSIGLPISFAVLIVCGVIYLLIKLRSPSVKPEEIESTPTKQRRAKIVINRKSIAIVKKDISSSDIGERSEVFITIKSEHDHDCHSTKINQIVPEVTSSS